MKRGLVTAEGAKRYGVVCNDDGVVDEAATKALRAEIRAKLPAKAPVFDKGPSLKDILARAEQETHLPAPRPPVFRPSHETARAAE